MLHARAFALTWLAVVPGFVSAAAAQQRALPAEARRMETTPAGSQLALERGLALPPAAPKLTAAGLLWSRADAGLAWIGSAVSVGDRGTQVFTEYDLNNEAAELFSVFDANPPTAIWTDNGPLQTEFRQVASADAVPVHVAVDQKVLNNNLATRQATVRKYSSSSAVPDWSYTFAPIINAQSNVGISRDGARIVAAIFDSTAFEVEIAVLDPLNGTPLSYTVVPTGTNNYLRGFDLSADGSTLYFTGGATFHLFDVASAQVVFSGPLQGLFDSHAISGDGSVVANGSFNALYLWEKQGAIWVQTFTHSVAGTCYCAEIDISDDSSTVAAGWTFYNTYLTVRFDALDVATQAVTMSNVATGTGNKQNIASDVSISADGSRFAAGVWGDAGGVVPECRIFSSSSSTALAALDLPGSVFDLELSADGQRAAFGSKAIHANDNGNGGRIDLLDVGGEDLFAHGAPRSGATLDFELHFNPGKNAFLMQSLGEDSTPNTFPGIGTLYIDRATLTFSPAGPVPANGVAHLNFTLPSNPALIGTPLYYQGFSVPPRELSDDWIKLTILP